MPSLQLDRNTMRAMSAHPVKTLALTGLLASVMGFTLGCGQKGPLYMPDNHPETASQQNKQQTSDTPPCKTGNCGQATE